MISVFVYAYHLAAVQCGMDLLQQLELNTPLPSEMQNQLIAWRRHLHRHPELSFVEHQTADYIVEQLSQMQGLQISRPTKTSVLAVLKGTKTNSTKRTILLRADTDALPITEENNFEFASQNAGIMHACGHDGHTAILLGVAKLLSENVEQLAGEVRFIFQHAEENDPGGAEELVFETPLMDGVDVVTGLHLNSDLPVGIVAVKAGAFMASPDSIEIHIQGKGGHAAHPEQVTDPIAIGAQIISNLQHVVSRRVAATDALVVSITQFHSGTTHNVIPDTAYLNGTVRSFDSEIRAQAPKVIEQVIKGICEAHGASYSFEYSRGYRPVINSEWVSKEIQTLAHEVVGSDKFVESRPSMGGEDFSAYLEKADGAYFNVGSGSKEADSYWSHHHPRFTIDERALEVGVRMLAAAAFKLGHGQAKQVQQA